MEETLVAPYENELARLKELFESSFGESPRAPFVFASAPGRVELAGNHTDHQGGRVISAAIDLRAYALAAPNETQSVRLHMEGFGAAEFDLSDEQALLPRTNERGTSIGLVRGMAAQLARRGGTLRGFDMVTISDIPSGAGLSSSAAFEMLVGRTLEALEEVGKIEETEALGEVDGETAAVPALDPVSLALDGMHVEQTYFGKPCGAQDQLASAFGGAVAMDFAQNPPCASALSFDTAAFGHALCLIDSKCDHSLFNDEFASIPGDMRAAATLFDGETLGEVDSTLFLGNLGTVREKLGDGAALRALHYFDETSRVEKQRRALEEGDFDRFLAHVRLSGASSAQYLQNVSPRGDGSGKQQPAMVILALCAHLLDDCGAWRIHGGGFGGSVLAFVPESRVDAFSQAMNELLDYSACRTLHIDPRGAFSMLMGA